MIFSLYNTQKKSDFYEYKVVTNSKRKNHDFSQWIIKYGRGKES